MYKEYKVTRDLNVLDKMQDELNQNYEKIKKKNAIAAEKEAEKERTAIDIEVDRSLEQAFDIIGNSSQILPTQTQQDVTDLSQTNTKELTVAPYNDTSKSKESDNLQDIEQEIKDLLGDDY